MSGCPLTSSSEGPILVASVRPSRPFFFLVLYARDGTSGFPLPLVFPLCTPLGLPKLLFNIVGLELSWLFTWTESDSTCGMVILLASLRSRHSAASRHLILMHFPPPPVTSEKALMTGLPLWLGNIMECLTWILFYQTSI